ncbi:MAG: PqqD family peptide modification chaperone [Thermosynechococcaceae cyanobacterium MS004]|nr:PqqD family peptide modification chaperone [Thermosynechococcaceae cyanobacterium MS004]
MNEQPPSADPVISPETVVVASPDQVSSDLAGESVILNLKTGTYYGLNSVGNSVWLLIQDPKSVREICEAITQEYEVDLQTCEQDIQVLLVDLLSAQLIEIKA